MATRAPTTVLLAMALTACTTLVLQIAATRVLSVTAGYHAAFVVIGVVMLGLAASATSVFVRSSERPLPVEAASAMLERGALLLTAGPVAYVWLGAAVPPAHSNGVHALAALLLFFGAFWCAGFAIALLLNLFQDDVGRVYWADLSGAAAGCLLAVPLLDATSAVNVLVLCGFGCATAGLLLRPDRTRHVGPILISGGVLAAALLWPPVTRLRVAKGEPQDGVLWEEWNHLARVAVTARNPGIHRAIQLLEQTYPDLDAELTVARWAMGWGMSERYQGEAPLAHWIDLDADAGTQIIPDGVARIGRDLPFLEADVTSAAHHVVSPRLDRAFVIGGGGGRDVLAARHFGAEAVVVAELNPSVVRAVDDVFRDVSGGTYSSPGVELHVGDARSILTRVDGRFDLIQMSMIDTWASSMAGVMVLAENGLYTREAFSLYLDRLEDDGVFTASRWYAIQGHGETARVLVLMRDALRRVGVAHPEQHVAAVVTEGGAAVPVVTLMMKRSPWTREELDRLRAWADRMAFRVTWPVDRQDPRDLDFGGVLREDAAWLASSSLDLQAPTDDRPFFFNVLRPVRSWVEAIRTGDPAKGSRSTVMLLGLLLVVAASSRVIVWAPLQRVEASKPASERLEIRDHARAIAYFAGIGFGFMWIEVATIQRYITFLGHPTYALSVVLFALLLCGGLGSAASERFGARAWLVGTVGSIVGALLTAFVVPSVTAAATAFETPMRIALAFALVAPMGFVMGTMYPSGVRWLEAGGGRALVPWVWAVNGVAGVSASILGMLIATSFGYTTVMVLGAAAYLLTGLAAMGPPAAPAARV